VIFDWTKAPSSPGYIGGGIVSQGPSAVAVAPVPADLLEALVARLKADSTVSGLVGARVYQSDLVRGQPALPFITVSSIAAGPTTFTFQDDEGMRDEMVQFSAFVENDSPLSERIGKAVRDCFSPRKTRARVVWDGGYEMTSFPGQERRLQDPNLSKLGLPIWHKIVEVRFMTGREL
jgi:hypothetical protein